MIAEPQQQTRGAPRSTWAPHHAPPAASGPLGALQRRADASPGVRALQGYRALLEGPAPPAGEVAQRAKRGRRGSSSSDRDRKRQKLIEDESEDEQEEEQDEEQDEEQEESGGGKEEEEEEDSGSSEEEGAGGLVVRRSEVQRDGSGVIAVLRGYYADSERPRMLKTWQNHALNQALGRQANRGREVELLKILGRWARGADGKTREFPTWGDAVLAAGMQLEVDTARKKRSPEEMEKRQRELKSLLGGISAFDQRKDEEELASSDEEAYEKMFPELLEQASQSTDVFQDPAPVRRRKQHKAGASDLGTQEVRYRTYTGTISPKPNAFVLGELDQDYGPLLRQLVAAIALDTEEEGTPLTDRDVAALFLREFDGSDAFGGFPPKTQKLAHKVITVIFFAELSRHSIALLTAAASFYAVATRAEKSAKPGLAESFETGGEGMRPLFAGKGGPSLMRGKESDQMTAEQAEQRRIRAMFDISNYFQGQKQEGEDIMGFVRRRTLEMLMNLSKHTDEASLQGAQESTALYGKMRRGYPAKKKGTTADETLQDLGFTRVSMPGDENDCAINTLYHQLTGQGVDLGALADFRNYVRKQPGVAGFGSMIDILGGGAALLAAAQSYLQNMMHADAVPGLAIDAWAATPDGGLMEFQNVARQAGTGERVLTFYYNGVNHFDSLTGGPGRQ